MRIGIHTPKENLWRFIITKVNTIPKSTNVSFKSNRNRGERRKKKERSKVEIEERLSGQKSVEIDSREEKLKVAVFRFKR